MHGLIVHFQDIAPTTRLAAVGLRTGNSATRRAAKYLPHCRTSWRSARVKWIEGSKYTGKDDQPLVQVRFQARLRPRLSQ